jgi:hypothetical protein
MPISRGTFRNLPQFDQSWNAMALNAIGVVPSGQVTENPVFHGTSADAVSADHRSLQVISLCSGWQIESG